MYPLPNIKKDCVTPHLKMSGSLTIYSREQKFNIKKMIQYWFTI
jgi:hypothetical protein